MLGKAEVKYLGQAVNAHNVRLLEDKVEAIRRHPCPGTKKEVQRYIWALNFYHRLCPALTCHLSPLNAATVNAATEGRERNRKIEKTPEFVANFEATRDADMRPPTIGPEGYAREGEGKVDPVLRYLKLLCVGEGRWSHMK